MSQRQPAIFRVHEEPDERRLREYREEVLSHNVPCGNLNHPPEVQKLLHRLNALPIAQALVTTAGPLPPGLPADRVVWVAGGRLEPGTGE